MACSILADLEDARPALRQRGYRRCGVSVDTGRQLSLRRRLGLSKQRLPDTTLRTFLCGLDIGFARKVLNAVAHAGWRKKQLISDVLPLGTVAMDGKYQSLNPQGDVVIERRFFVSSLKKSKLSPAQWLRLVVRHWAVETVHQILDVGFKEDEHPGIETSANGALVLSFLRRAAYTLMTLFKYRRIRGLDDQYQSFRKTMEQLRDSALLCTEKILQSLRGRRPKTL